MNRKQIEVKHALKRTATALRIILMSAFLFGSHSALMNVQAACEAPQGENMVEESQAEPEAKEAVENTEAEVQAQPESAEEVVQPEDAAEEVPVPSGDMEEMQALPEEAESVTEPLSVTMVGDSVMLGASPSILGMMPDCVIDAKVSRQVVQADGVLDALEQQNTLRQTVVIALGTNGPFSVAKGQELIDRLGSGRTIYWVTAYGRDLSWQEDSNATIRQLAETNENVHIIDWAQAASGHAEWLCSDGIHLNAAGRDAYAGIILGGLSY